MRKLRLRERTWPRHHSGQVGRLTMSPEWLQSQCSPPGHSLSASRGFAMQMFPKLQGMLDLPFSLALLSSSGADCIVNLWVWESEFQENEPFLKKIKGFWSIMTRANYLWNKGPQRRPNLVVVFTFWSQIETETSKWVFKSFIMNI